MLARMYTRWAEKKGYKVELQSETAGDEAVRAFADQRVRALEERCSAEIDRAGDEPAARTAALVDAVRPVLAASDGRAFLLFASHRALRETAALLRDMPPDGSQG